MRIHREYTKISVVEMSWRKRHSNFVGSPNLYASI